jgi:glutaminase
MGATLANHGKNPISKAQVIDSRYTSKIMAIMATAGLYDNAGDWLYDTGAPAKSGVGGGILAVIPGKFGIGIVSPPLDKYGNSVRAQLAAKYIIEKLNLNPLAQ